MNTRIDVFISRKSQDAHYAKELYDHLCAQGLNVFESDESLPKLGNSDYRNAIDDALDACKHLIVVGSSIDNIRSEWVEHEWGSYLNEKLAGRKKGNVLTIITGNLSIAELPLSLRSHQVFFFSRSNFEKIYAYVEDKKVLAAKEAQRQKEIAEAHKREDQARLRAITEEERKAREQSEIAETRAHEEQRQKEIAEAEIRAREEQRQRELAAAAKAQEEQRQKEIAEAEIRAREEQHQRELAVAAKAQEEQRQKEIAEAEIRAREEQHQRELAVAAKAQEEQRQKEIAEAETRAREEQRQRELAAAAKTQEEQRQKEIAEAQRNVEHLRKEGRKNSNGGTTALYITIVVAVIVLGMCILIWVNDRKRDQYYDSSNTMTPATYGDSTTTTTADPAIGEDCIKTLPVMNDNGGYNEAVYSPDGKYIASCIAFKHPNAFTLWDAVTGERVRTYTSEFGVYQCVFFPSGMFMLSGNENKPMIVWDVTTGEINRTFTGVSRNALKVAMNAYHNVFATISDYKTLKLWNFESGKCLHTIEAASKWDILSVAISPDGKYVLTGADNGELQLRDIATGNVVYTLVGHKEGAAWSVCFNSSGTVFASGSGKEVKLWDHLSGNCLATFDHDGLLNNVKFIYQDKYLLSSSGTGSDPVLKLWSIADKRCIHTFEGHRDMICSIDYDPATGHAITASHDGTVKIWNVGQYLDTGH
ncbi:hypothetical protein GCM10023093_17280 [Nemorincola caseinilytica]|uniref:TIR domain-containing protein n=1 Tax=Nemorincola caseinilytica TaxID=2054315 RepID=A0ABP8NG61_9BACT